MSSRRSPRTQDTEAHLLEQVKLLKLENETLRNFIAEKGFAGALHPNTGNTNNEANKEKKTRRGSVTGLAPKAKSPNIQNQPGTPKAGGRGCSCKGNCSTKVCGCVKRGISCAEFCRCGDELCQNSEPDKENIGDPNHEPQLSKDAADSLTKLSKLALTENKGSKLAHPAFEPLNKQIDQVGKIHSLFSPNVANNVVKLETTGDIEFENISLRFGEDSDTETAEAAGKAGGSGGAKTVAGKKSKKDETRDKNVAGSSAAMEEAVAEKKTTRKNRMLESKKAKEKAAVKGNKRQASKARIRYNSSESEAEDKMDSDDDEKAVAQEPVKGKAKKRKARKARIVSNSSESEAEEKIDTEEEEDEEREAVKEKPAAPMKNNKRIEAKKGTVTGAHNNRIESNKASDDDGHGRMNKTKKESKKGKPVAGPVQGNKRQASKSRVRNNGSESEVESKIDDEWQDEEAVEEPVKEKSRGRKKNAKNEGKKGKPVHVEKRKASRVRIVSSNSESEVEEKIDTEEEEEQEAVKEKRAVPMKNSKKIETKKETVTDAQNNRVESNKASEDDGHVERDPRKKNNKNDEKRVKKTTSAQAQDNLEASGEYSEDYADCEPVQNNNNDEPAEANDEQMETDDEKYEEGDLSELSPTSSRGSNDLTRAIDNSMSPEAAADFNPMKPRRQLSRSPLVSKTLTNMESNESHVQRHLDLSERLLPAPLQEEAEEAPPEPEELKEVVLEDWDKHKANLVKCTKCGRKLFPYRIKKHEAHCQKI